MSFSMLPPLRYAFAAADDFFSPPLDADTAMLPPAIQVIKAHARQRRAHAAQHAAASDCALPICCCCFAALFADAAMPPCRRRLPFIFAPAMPYVMPVFTPMRCRFSRRQRAMLAIISPARFVVVCSTVLRRVTALCFEFFNTTITSRLPR